MQLLQPIEGVLVPQKFKNHHKMIPRDKKSLVKVEPKEMVRKDLRHKKVKVVHKNQQIDRQLIFSNNKELLSPHLFKEEELSNRLIKTVEIGILLPEQKKQVLVFKTIKIVTVNLVKVKKKRRRGTMKAVKMSRWLPQKMNTSQIRILRDNARSLKVSTKKLKMCSLKVSV